MNQACIKGHETMVASTGMAGSDSSRSGYGVGWQELEVGKCNGGVGYALLQGQHVKVL